MKLFIVRHAIAVPHGTPGYEEEARPLTEAGIEKMRRATGGLRALEVQPDVILSSPLPRARQTAEILVTGLGGKPDLQITEALAPGGSRQRLYAGIQALPESADVVLVGHQPSLGEIAGEIAWGSPKHYIELKKGGACCIELTALRPLPRGTLLWLMPPAIMRALA